MRGTLLNTATVVVGAGLGLLVGGHVSEEYKLVALHGLGLVTVGIGLKMFVGVRNPLVPAIAISVGGMLGLLLGLHAGVERLAYWAELRLNGMEGFATGMITSFVLFCIGPMTLLGCLEDGLEGKIDLLTLKSTMDGIAAFFLAAATGAGVLVTAVLLFLFQGALTLGARPMRKFAENPELLAETSAVGGALLLGTGIGLLGLADLKMTNFLPAVFIAPVVFLGFRRFKRPPGAPA